MDDGICEKSKVPCLSSFIVYGALKEDLNLKFKKYYQVHCPFNLRTPINPYIYIIFVLVQFERRHRFSDDEDSD